MVSQEWVSEPLLRVTPHQLSFQQLFGKLDFALYLHKESMRETVRNKEVFNPTTNSETVNLINYVGQLRLRHDSSSQNTKTSRQFNKRSPLDVQGCFNCDFPDHMAKNRLLPLNLTRAASRRLEYLNKKKMSHAAHTVLAEKFHQFESDQRDEQHDSKTFMNLLREDNSCSNVNDRNGFEDSDGVLVLERSVSVTVQSGVSHGACFNSGAQLTVFGLEQSNVHCDPYGGHIIPIKTPTIFRIGNNSHKGVGTLKIRVPVSGSHILDASAFVMDVKIPSLIVLIVLTHLNAILDVRENTISSPTEAWELPLFQKLGQLYIEWPSKIFFTVSELHKLHKHFFHIQPDKIFHLLRRSNHGNVDTSVLEKLHDITRSCDVCQPSAGAPNRFKGSLPHSDLLFNRYVCLDCIKTELIDRLTCCA